MGDEFVSEKDHRAQGNPYPSSSKKFDPGNESSSIARESSDQAVIVKAYRAGQAVHADEFLDDNELHFLEHLSRNEALLEYHHCI